MRPVQLKEDSEACQRPFQETTAQERDVVLALLYEVNVKLGIRDRTVCHAWTESRLTG